MESISTKKLPPIFKLSLLSKILPYFGYLHDWKRILEWINNKTNDIWDQNKEVLKYWGRDLKLSLHLENCLIKLSENILLKAELFKFETARFFNFHRGTLKALDKIKELKIDSLILQLCNQLNEDNTIVFQKWDDKIDEIFLQTRKDIAEMIPSSKCTSSILEIKEFEDSQAQDLWKYIADNIKLKRIIVKKNENNTFEVDSITSHHYLDWNEYDILYEEIRERLVTYYSCPVNNCICKPKTLWLSLWNRYPYEISKELIDEIWELSLLENAHQLTIEGNVKSLSQISYLSRIKQQFPKLEILFDFYSERDDIEWERNYQIHINSKLITLVTKGEENIFHISGDKKWYVSSIVDLEFNEKESIAIVNWGLIWLSNIILQTNNQSEIKDQTLIDKLKEKTRFEDNQYIIVDTSTLELWTYAFQIEKYITIAKYFKLINIRIKETEYEYIEEIEEINKLPKQWSIRIWVDNMHEFVNSDALSLIDQDFDRIIVESEELKIKLIKSNSRSRERIFTVFESLFYKTKTANIRELREMFPENDDYEFLSEDEIAL